MARASRELKPRQINSQKRITLPPEVLRALDADTDDFVSFIIEGSDVRIIKVTIKPSR